MNQHAQDDNAHQRPFWWAKGITGFRSYKDSELPVVDLRTFNARCQTAAINLGAKVIDVEEASVGNNFHAARVIWKRPPLTILCNAVFPIVAFEREGQFIECAEWTDALGDEFAIALPIELALPFRLEDESILDESELEQIRYWKPNRVGDVVFNHWD